MNVARKPVQLRDDQCRFLLAALPKSFRQCRPVVPLATLDFNDLAQEHPGTAVEVSRDGGTLRGLFELRTGDRPPLPLDEEESAADIVKRMHCEST